jgi:homoserine dehydrogenase
MKWNSYIHAQNVFIIGATWSVGRELIYQISDYDSIENNHTHPTRILGVANSKKILLSVDDTSYSGLSWTRDANINADITTHGIVLTAWYDSILWSLDILGISMSDIVFIDVTADGSRANLDFHLRVIKSGGSIVTANKNPLALSSIEEFYLLTQDRLRYLYRSSVMAWWPAVSELLNAYDTRNKVHSIEGCFSGTLAYICSGLEKWESFSSIVRDAHTRKYTEPNPWDDLSGHDVMRKILILARTAGFQISAEDITIKPFIDKGFSGYTSNEFFDQIEALDGAFEAEIRSSQAKWETLRYVAKLWFNWDTLQVSVWPRYVEKQSSLWSLQGTHNKVIITTDNFVTEFSRPWAGIQNTANSIRVDLAWLLKKRIA